MKVFATYSIKGGVGKTSAAVNLAHLAARDGLRTLVWDLDPQGAATYLLRVKPKTRSGGAAALISGKRSVADSVKETSIEGLDVVPADFSYRDLELDLDGEKKSTHRVAEALKAVRKDYDVVLIDAPPGASLVARNVVIASDVLVVPVVPALLSVRTFEQVTDFVRESSLRRPEVLGFLSMVDRRKKAHREFVESLPEEHRTMSTVSVPALSVVEQMAVERAPVTAYSPRSAAAKAYQDLWFEVHKRLGVRQPKKVVR